MHQSTEVPWEWIGDAQSRLLFDKLGTKVWMADPTTLEITFVSEPLAALLGLPAGERLPVYLERHVQACHRARVSSACREVARSGEARSLEYRAIARGGEVAWFACELRPLRDSEGIIQAVAAVLVDITRERIAAEARTHAALQYEELVNTLDGIVWEANASLRLTFVSKQAERVLGYPVQRWLEDPMFWVSHLHPDDRDRCVDFCKEQFRLGLPHRLEYRMITAEGHVVWLRDYVSMIASGDRRLGLRGVMVDISEEKRAEQALRESEARYRYLYNNTPVMMHSISRDGTLLSVSNAWLEALGYEQSEVIGRKSVSFLAPESRKYVEELVLPAYFQSGVCKDVPYQFVKKNGELLDVLLSATAERDAQGEVLRSVAVLVDMTERKRAEEERARLLVEEQAARKAAERALAQLDTLLMTAPVGFGFLDKELRAVRVNTTLAAIHGRRPEEAIGNKLGEAIPGLLETVEPLMRQVLQTGEPVTGVELTAELPDTPGERRDWLASYYPIKTPTETLGLGVVVVDVTEQRRASETQARLYREAQEAIRVRDDFLAIASHELKTPLTPLAMYLQLLERKLRAHERVDVSSVEKALRQLNQVKGLINDLLDVSRIQAGRLALRLEPTSMRELVRELVASHQHVSRLHRIELEEPAEAFIVDGDRARLAQVVTNLLDNAVKYSHDGGMIRVRLVRREEEVLLSVSDSGIGIPKAQQPHLFERFFRATNSPISSYGGLGLGLYISRDIVERHGGRIWVESDAGRGACFYVALPRHVGG